MSNELNPVGPSTALVRSAPIVRTPALSDRARRRLQTEAALVARSSLIGPQLRGKPDEILTLALQGHAFGLDLVSSTQQIFIVDGKPCSSAKLCGALVARAGVWMAIEETDATHCTVVGCKPGDPPGFLRRLTWTIDEARAAGLAKKDNWAKYPAAMLRARAVKAWATAHCPEALMGWHDDVPLEEMLGYTPEDDDTAPDDETCDAGPPVDVIDAPIQKTAGQRLYDTVVLLEGTFAATELKAMAAENNRRLTATDFDGYPEWALRVAQYVGLLDDDERRAL